MENRPLRTELLQPSDVTLRSSLVMLYLWSVFSQTLPTIPEHGMTHLHSAIVCSLQVSNCWDDAGSPMFLTACKSIIIMKLYNTQKVAYRV